ncbi:MAG: GNAT family N-acetyltransferase [Rhodospirillales bacterium]|nr:GNAT family N-acetyltransferase [Alphaproteobacteria bacterium]MCB9987677.1 GNAT family N-acetyltransferase [Rhodospirillales bacterium]USO08023.1 MAG: GNAT family N-acetyltransferase [Rhodospirillales bacterium]
MSKVYIRLFEPRDAEAVVRMNAALARFRGATSLANAAQFIAGAALGKIWVAEILGLGLVGFVAGYDWMDYVLGVRVRQIDLLYVDDACRHKGVGKMLVHALVHDATACGCGRIDVTDIETNELAAQFYLALGFQASHRAGMRYSVSGDALGRLAP